ncbi:MAG: hypothetical protein Q7U60_04705 [Candidatus Methanoperedens sp.]|nr:hypothetical protein [Candidatus Methanoperedens sp.]
MTTESGQLIECTLVGNIYDKNRDLEIKRTIELKNANRTWSD